jgi:hypothetical protein
MSRRSAPAGDHVFALAAAVAPHLLSRVLRLPARRLTSCEVSGPIGRSCFYPLFLSLSLVLVLVLVLVLALIFALVLILVVILGLLILGFAITFNLVVVTTRPGRSYDAIGAT